MGLGLFAAISAGAGVALAKDAKAEPVKADAPKTWMIRVQLDLAECSPNYEECVFPEDKPVIGAKFHYWGTNIDATDAVAEYMCFSTYDRYGVNISLRDDQIITGACWAINQKDVGWLWSIDIDSFGESTNPTLAKGNPYFAIQWQFVNTWTGDGKWQFVSGTNWGYPKGDLQMSEQTEGYVEFEAEPENNVFAVRNFDYSDPSHWVGCKTGGTTVALADLFYPMIDEESKQYRGSGSSSWFYLTGGTGLYDFILGNGKFSIKKHSAKNESYIYYVLEDNTPTEHYIYSWGGSEQFGSWPGTKITAVEDVEEVTRNGVLHFEGSETPKLIYRIPIATGYPDGDDHFKFNDNASWESESREIVLESAYWYTGSANADAGDAIDLLIIAETYRNLAEDYSVCNISESDAKFIVDRYNAETDEVRDYVDRSSVYTYKEDKSGGNELVSYRRVIERLGIIGGVTPVGGSPRNPFVTDNTIEANSAALIAAVSIIAIVSISTVAVLVVIKKRKHE